MEEGKGSLGWLGCVFALHSFLSQVLAWLVPVGGVFWRGAALGMDGMDGSDGSDGSPFTEGSSDALDAEFEEMGGAGDAGIVVANGLFAAERELGVGKVGVLRYEIPEVAFDGPLVL
jgi:hypothetical protein